MMMLKQEYFLMILWVSSSVLELFMKTWGTLVEYYPGKKSISQSGPGRADPSAQGSQTQTYWTYECQMNSDNDRNFLPHLQPMKAVIEEGNV